MAPTYDHGTSLFDFVVRDGNGIKGLVDSGLVRVPEQYVQPPKERIDIEAAFSGDNKPIDLSGLDGLNRGLVVAAIAKAAESVGFFQVVNHGLSLQLLESVKEVAHKFFSLPAEKKAVYLRGVSASRLVMYGTSFVPEKEKALEWKDYVSMVYSNDEEALAQWPIQCKEVALQYLKLSTQMAKKIVEALMEHLGVEINERRVDELLGLRKVNINFYPTCPNPDLTVGVGRHSDLGTLTVLLQDGIGGLYVRAVEENNFSNPKTQGLQERWMEIPPLPGALVINVGDVLQILSNGRYKSVEHRVRTTSTNSRVSIPMFAMPLPSEKIGPLPQLVEADGFTYYREFVFEDYMDYYFGNSHEGKKSLDDFAQIIG